MKNYFLYLLYIIIPFSTLSFSYSSEESFDDLIMKEYSYLYVTGLDLNINPNDYFKLNSDYSFDYKVDSIKSAGIRFIQKDTLVLNYNYPKDTIRKFNIVLCTVDRLYLT